MLKRWILPAATFVLLLIAHIPQTHATTKYWNGTGTGAFNVGRNWSLYGAGSGSTTTAPTASDIAIFDGGSNVSAHITESMTGGSIVIRSTYTNTIVLSGSVVVNLNNLAIGNSSATVKMGTNSKLILQAAGTSLTGTGTLNTTANSPNTVEYTAPVASITAAAPALAYSNLTIDPSGLSRSRAITFNSGEDTAVAGVTDLANGFTYIATSTSPGKLVKVRLSDMTQVGTLTFNSGDNLPQMKASIDTTNGYAYFGAIVSPGKIIKVNLSDFTETASLTLGSGENQPFCSSIDVANGYLYAGVFTIPAKIAKIRLSDFTEVAVLTLAAGEDRAYGCDIDTTNGFFYVATNTSPGKIIKIRLSDFTEVSALTLASGENSLLRSAVIDPTGTYLYTGTQTSPGKIIKVQLSDMTEVAAITLDSGEDNPSSMAFIENGFLYVSARTSPGKILKIRLSDFTRAGTITLNSGENIPTTMASDANGYGYIGTVTSPIRLVRFSLGSTPTLNLGTAASQTLTVNGTFTLGDGINAAPVTAATYNPVLDLNGSLILNAGSTLTASSTGLFTLSGDLTNKGTFTGNGGTLTLDGSAQTLSGSITFYKLSKTTGSSLAIAHGSTITTEESLTLFGTESSLLNVHSTNTTHPWYINSSHNRSIQYLSLSDSTNTGVPITCLDCSNDGNNTNWLFSLSPANNAISSSGNTGGGGGGGGGTRSTNSTTSTSSSSKGPTTQPSSSPNTTTPSSYFADVSATAWYFSYVTELNDLHIIEGYKDQSGTPLHLFGPADPVTYAQLAKLALGTAGESIQENQGTNWAQPYIDRTHALHYSVFTTTLNENLPATRGAVIQTLLEALRIPLDQPSTNYSDVPTTHPFAKAIATATKLGLIQGDTNADGSPKNTFRPNAQVNRAELSKILILARQLPKQPLSALPPSEPTPPPSEVITPSTQTVTTKFAVNVRSEPAMSSPILLQLPPNTTVDRLSSIGVWIQVRLPDGRTGYLVGSYLK